MISLHFLVHTPAERASSLQSPVLRCEGVEVCFSLVRKEPLSQPAPGVGPPVTVTNGVETTFSDASACLVAAAAAPALVIVSSPLQPGLPSGPPV